MSGRGPSNLAGLRIDLHTWGIKLACVPAGGSSQHVPCPRKTKKRRRRRRAEWLEVLFWARKEPQNQKKLPFSAGSPRCERIRLDLSGLHGALLNLDTGQQLVGSLQPKPTLDTPNGIPTGKCGVTSTISPHRISTAVTSKFTPRLSFPVQQHLGFSGLWQFPFRATLPVVWVPGSSCSCVTSPSKSAQLTPGDCRLRPRLGLNMAAEKAKPPMIAPFAPVAEPVAEPVAPVAEPVAPVAPAPVATVSASAAKLPWHGTRTALAARPIHSNGGMGQREMSFARAFGQQCGPSTAQQRKLLRQRDANSPSFANAAQAKSEFGQWHVLIDLKFEHQQVAFRNRFSHSSKGT